MPTQLYDTTTGLPTATQNPEQDFLGGKVGVLPDQTVPLVDPESGSTFDVPSDLVPFKLGSGMQFETASQEALRNLRTQAQSDPGGAVKAGLDSFVNQTFLGVPDIVENAESPESAQYTEMLKEEHPGWSIAGGLGGFATSAVYGGPLWEGAGFAGEAAAKTVASLADTAGPTVANIVGSKIAQNAVSGAVQGAIVSSPAALTEAALGDPNTAAESLLAGAGTGGLLMGGGTALAQPIGAALRLAGETLNPEALENAANVYQLKQMGILKQGLNKVVQMFPRNSIPESYSAAVSELDQMGLTGMKSGALGSDQRFNTVKDIQQNTGDALNEVRATADKTVPNAVNFSLLDDPLQQLRKSYNNVPGQITGSLGSVDDNIAALQDFKAQIAERTNATLTPDDPNRIPVTKFANGRSTIGEYEGPVYGTTEDLHNYKQSLRDINYPSTDPYNPEFRPKKNDGAEGSHQAVSDLMDSTLEGIASKDGSGNLSDQLSSLNKKYAMAQRWLPILRQAAVGADARNSYSLGDMIMSGVGGLMGGWPGELIGGAANMVRRKYGNQLMANSLYGASSVLDNVSSQAARGIDESLGIAPNVPTFNPMTDVPYSEATHPTPQPSNAGRPANFIPPSIGIMARYFAGDPNAPKDKIDQIQQISRNAGNFLADQQAASQILPAVTGDLQNEMPTIHTSMQSSVQRAINYIQSASPTGNNAPLNPLGPLPAQPSAREISQFQQKLQAVMDPISTLKDLHAGTLTQAHMEALSAVYPNMLKSLQDRIAQRLPLVTKPISATRKAALNLFMNNDPSSNVDSGTIGAYQSAFQPQGKPQPRANTKITQSGRVGTDISAVTSGQ